MDDYLHRNGMCAECARKEKWGAYVNCRECKGCHLIYCTQAEIDMIRRDRYKVKCSDSGKNFVLDYYERQTR